MGAVHAPVLSSRSLVSTRTPCNARCGRSTRSPISRGAFGGDDEFVIVGKPTSAALRVAGHWPSPEGLLERLVAALEAAGDDESRDQEERSRFKQIALWLGGAASQVAINALGGAGGNLLTG